MIIKGQVMINPVFVKAITGFNIIFTGFSYHQQFDFHNIKITKFAKLNKGKPLKKTNHIINLNGKIPAFYLGVLFIFISSFGLPQTGNDIVVKISNALNTGDVQVLSRYFGNIIDLTLPDGEGTYSNKQTEQLLKAFFKSNPVKSFMLDHSGNSNDGSKYLIGTLKSTSGKSFRFYALIKKQAGTYLIQQLELEEE